MLCSYPVRLSSPDGLHTMVSCGRCLPCLINKRSQWTLRILLESWQHESSLFTTLTYSPSHLPSDGKLVPRDLKLFCMRLRKLRQTSTRYFCIGEYGSKTNRPHYHGILFGLSLDDAQLVTNCWQKGFTKSDVLNPARARYVADYTTKSISQGDTFARMSRRPGLGLKSLEIVADALRKHDVTAQTVPSGLRLDGRVYLLDSRCKDELRRLLPPGDKYKDLDPDIVTKGRNLAYDLQARAFITIGDDRLVDRNASAVRAHNMRHAKIRHEVL